MGDKPGHPFRGNQYTRAGLISALTQEDIKRSQKAIAKGRWDNPHAIAIELEAADRVDERVRKGEDPSSAFADEFNPTRENHRIARKLGLDLTIERGRWESASAASEKKAAERAARIAEFHERTGTLDFAKEEAKASKMTDAELAFAREDARKAAEAMGRDNPKQGYYSDQGSVYAREQQKRAQAPNLDHLKNEAALPAKVSDVPEGGKGVYVEDYMAARERRRPEELPDRSARDRRRIKELKDELKDHQRALKESGARESKRLDKASEQYLAHRWLSKGKKG
jgi:hypothetical protein